MYKTYWFSESPCFEDDGVLLDSGSYQLEFQLDTNLASQTLHFWLSLSGEGRASASTQQRITLTTGISPQMQIEWVIVSFITFCLYINLFDIFWFTFKSCCLFLLRICLNCIFSTSYVENVNEAIHCALNIRAGWKCAQYKCSYYYYYYYYIIHHFILIYKSQQRKRTYINYMRKSPGHILNSRIRRAYIKYTQWVTGKWIHNNK